MEKIIVEEPVFKTVQSRTKKVTKYKTSDGRIFDKEKDAISYELQLETVNKIKGIKKIFFENFDFLPNTMWYYASNEEEINLIIERLGAGYCIYHLNNGKFDESKFKVGDWITAIYYDGGDYRGDNDYFTLEYVMKEITEFMEKLRI